MALATNLGFPRIGPNRELKKAVEAYWDGKLNETQLRHAAEEIRRDNWRYQQRHGLAHIPSNDFSLYDHMLDTTAIVGAIPSRYGHAGESIGLDTYFAMARGTTGGNGKPSVPAMEMTKWFDTNYHYIVPEFEKGQRFRLLDNKPLRDYLDAKAIGIETRPVLVGPVTYLLLGKAKDPSVKPLDLLDSLLPVYERVLSSLAAVAAQWVQIDEPALGLTLDDATREAYHKAYARLAAAVPSLKLLTAVYFSDLRDNLDTALRLPVAGLHLDLVRGPGQLAEVLPKLGPAKVLSVGVV
ncbi:MAG: 5-methyltetrahydropteroyltriglutamate--homocysteine S-methyltransferase, partial [SAR202 cluster bacterium]|nr:5-methyltetrahydropteroyltriglutamate--homocysteine S-methyltransferase [SAR202 cluster bacterium]